MLTVHERQEGSLLVFALAGKLDGASYEDLGALLAQRVEEGERRLALELGQVTYLNSAGLRVLGEAAQVLSALDGCLALVGARGPVAEVLRISGFSNLLPTFPSLEDAVSEIR